MNLSDYERRRRPREVTGISAVLLPYANGQIDESSFHRHLQRTLAAGLRVAVNMDTGYGDLLTPEEKLCVLRWTSSAYKDDFFAGALPSPSSESVAVAYTRECAVITEHGGVPVIFPSVFTARMDDASLIAFFREIANAVPRFLAFELGEMFNPHGRMFSERVLRALMDIPACTGMKHSSLDRHLELERLALRDRTQPEFVIYSGNDLAADMIEYGSDYLLGLSTFAPELFAARDRAWCAQSDAYLGLRDAIQYLGWTAFRPPVPAYKHSAAVFLHLSGGISADETHPRAPRRPSWERDLMADAWEKARAAMNVSHSAGVPV